VEIEGLIGGLMIFQLVDFPNHQSSIINQSLNLQSLNLK